MRKKTHKRIRKAKEFINDIFLLILELIFLPFSLIIFLISIPIKRANRIYNTLDKIHEDKKFRIKR